MKLNTKKLTFISFCIAINIIGSLIAFMLKLPIYLDSIGTVFIGLLYGPAFASLTGALSSSISGILFDVYSFYFVPVQIVLGFLIGCSRKSLSKGMSSKIFRIFLITIPVAFIGAVIVAVIFNGITSSGSAYIVQFLKILGLNTVSSVFITQFITDFFDKLFATLLSEKIINSKAFKYIHNN